MEDQKTAWTWITAGLTTLGLIVASAGYPTASQAQDQITPGAPRAVDRIAALLPSDERQIWREFVQLAWNGETGEIDRLRFSVHDPLGQEDLALSWHTDAPVVVAGPLTGTGRLEWRDPNARSFGKAGLIAVFDGPVVEGQLTGDGRFWHRSGTTYDGQWSDGLMEGTGYLQLGDGRSYRGAFQTGRFHGAGLLTQIDGATFEGQFRNGQPHGDGIETRADGLKYASAWVDGAEDLTQRHVLIRPEDLEPTLAQQLSYPDLSFGVTVDQLSVQSEYDIQSYVGQNVGDQLITFPVGVAFMQAWRGGGEILRDPEFTMTDQFVPANFLMSLENRGTAPVQVVGGYLAVEVSQPDLDPLFRHRTDMNCGQPYITEVRIKNYGWSDPISASIAGGIISRDGTQFLLPLNIDNLTGWPIAKFDLLSVITGADPRLATLVREGLHCPIDDFDQCTQAAVDQGLFGPFGPGAYQSFGSIMVDFYGTMTTQWRDHTGQVQQKQNTMRVPIKIGKFNDVSECGEGSDYDTPFPSPFKLPLNQLNYQLPFALNGVVDPGSVANWNFQIDADASSRHIFSVVLQLSDGREVASRPVDLAYLVPRTLWNIQ